MGDNISELAITLGRALQSNKLLLSTAESCTGGGIAQAITDVAGSSRWFDRGFVTYSNLAKTQMLGVHKSSIDKFGAVSQTVAIEMAEGALIHSVADITIAVTGIAGPSGGSEEKPVGSVFIAWKKIGQITGCDLHIFSGNRQYVREQTIYHALEKCLSLI